MAGTHKDGKRFDKLTPAQRRSSIGAMTTNLKKARETHKRLLQAGK